LRVAETKLQRAVIGSVGYWGLGWRQSPIVTGSVRLDADGYVLVPRYGTSSSH
jgi:hypothetical protein